MPGEPFPTLEVGDGASAAARQDGVLARRLHLQFVRQYGVWRGAVRELWRFKWREHRGREVLGAYRTRRGVPYFIRHVHDTGIFHEVFIPGEYEPPPAVARLISSLGRPPRVLDLGGNIGLFAVWCRDRWPGARVVSVEPDPDNLELLRRTAGAGEGIDVVAACAGREDGSVRFVAGKFCESHVADSDSTEATIEVPCVDVFPMARSADVVKMDIEGSEWEILADARLADPQLAPVWVIEWHIDRCPSADPTAAARSALQDAGFDVLGERPHPAATPGYGTFWAIRAA
jgi:FkbM family methyltransferase